MQPGFDGAHGDIQVRCYLTVSEALQVEEPDRVALTCWQGRHCGADAGDEVSSFGRFSRTRVRGRGVPVTVEDLRAELPKPPPGHIERNPAEPGAETIRRAQGSQVRHDSYRGFLRSITSEVS